MNDKASNARHEPGPEDTEGARSASRVDRGADGLVIKITPGRVVGVVAAVSLLLGIMIGPIVNGGHTLAADASPTPEHTVTVSGVADLSVAPDVADVVIGVTVQKPTVAAAQSGAATLMSAVIAAAEKDGVDAKDIVTVNLSLSPVYDYSSNGSAPKLVGQQFSNTIKVTVRNLKSLASVVDDAVAAGATTLSGISFRLNDPSTVQVQARQLAMKDARAKADTLTSAAGVAVKGVASITETSSQPTPIYYSGALDAAKAAASTPIQTGTTDIVVQVTVTYLIG